MPTRLGQNFLRDNAVLDQIITAANLKADDFVIEIGPGEGALSQKLLQKTPHLIMIEKDANLAQKMARKFQCPLLNFQPNYPDQSYNFSASSGIISGDILEINLPKLIEENDFSPYKVVANIPYYITSPILQLFLETIYPPQEMILMVQKEVAERICAQPGNLSLLALSVTYYAKPELLFYVDKKSFFPVPEVDSAVIKISYKKQVTDDKQKTKNFFRIAKAGFSAKRKTILNNLSNSLPQDKKEVEEILQKAGIDPKVRAQELSLENWKKLAELFFG